MGRLGSAVNIFSGLASRWGTKLWWGVWGGRGGARVVSPTPYPRGAAAGRVGRPRRRARCIPYPLPSGALRRGVWGGRGGHARAVIMLPPRTQMVLPGFGNNAI